MSRSTKKSDKNRSEEPPKRILLIGESDSLGASGIQGDIKTVLALGGYAMTAITALTSHKSKDIVSIKNIPPSFVKEQITSIVKDVGVDAVKVGFLRDNDIIKIVADVLMDLRSQSIPIVVDPCIVSRSKKVLMHNDDIAALKRDIYIHTTILTPNLQETETLGGMNIQDLDDLRHAADMMRTLGVENVILKGGQVESNKELYFVATSKEERVYERETLDTFNTLGAGGVLSSALSVNLAKKMDVFDAVEHALSFLHQTILHSTGFDSSIEGPVNHAFAIQNQPSIFHAEDVKIYKM